MLSEHLKEFKAFFKFTKSNHVVKTIYDYAFIQTQEQLVDCCHSFLLEHLGTVYHLDGRHFQMLFLQQECFFDGSALVTPHPYPFYHEPTSYFQLDIDRMIETGDIMVESQCEECYSSYFAYCGKMWGEQNIDYCEFFNADYCFDCAPNSFNPDPDMIRDYTLGYYSF